MLLVKLLPVSGIFILAISIACMIVMFLLGLSVMVAIRMLSKEDVSVSRIAVTGSVPFHTEHNKGGGELTPDICPYILSREGLDVRAEMEANHLCEYGNTPAHHHPICQNLVQRRLVHCCMHLVKRLLALYFCYIACAFFVARYRGGNDLIHGDACRRVQAPPLCRRFEHELCRSHQVYLNILEPLSEMHRGLGREQAPGSYLFVGEYSR